MRINDSRSRVRASLRLFSLALLGLAAAACGDDRGSEVDIDFDDEDSPFAGAEATLEEGDVFATMTENGVVRLALTDERVYFELSDAVRETVDSTIDRDLEQSDSRIARSIGAAVRRGVAAALRFDIDYSIHDIRDVDYRAGELVFEFEDPDDGRVLQNAEIDEEPLTRAFAADDARAFVAAFRQVKSRQGTDRAESDADSAGPTAPRDTAGGGTF